MIKIPKSKIFYKKKYKLMGITSPKDKKKLLNLL